MLVYEKNEVIDEIKEMVDRFGRGREALMPILQELQGRHHCISDFAQQEIARQLAIHPVEIHSVISFYTFLNEKMRGQNHVRLCRTISCEMAGKKKIVHAIQRELGIKFGQTTKDGKITLEYTNCLGMCDQGPAMLVNDSVHGKLTPEKAVEILNEIQ
jgi:NADH:ubiquinone oxidoreductase subunit E